MSTRSNIKNTAIALAGTVLFGCLAWTSPADAGYRSGWGAYRPVVVHRHVVRHPMYHRVAYSYRPIVYRPRPIVRRVVIVERPYYRRARYGYGYGWGHRVGYRPRWHGGWNHRPRCWLPERHLCR